MFEFKYTKPQAEPEKSKEPPSWGEKNTSDSQSMENGNKVSKEISFRDKVLGKNVFPARENLNLVAKSACEDGICEWESPITNAILSCSSQPLTIGETI